MTELYQASPRVPKRTCPKAVSTAIRDHLAEEDKTMTQIAATDGALIRLLEGLRFSRRGPSRPPRTSGMTAHHVQRLLTSDSGECRVVVHGGADPYT